LLIAARGNMRTPVESARPPAVIHAPRREHSRKPDEAYALIERMYPDLPKIELFARAARAGWARWGNEAPPAEPHPLEVNGEISTAEQICAVAMVAKRSATKKPAKKTATVGSPTSTPAPSPAPSLTSPATAHAANADKPVLRLKFGRGDNHGRSA
jgi:hypothetical protein